MVVIKLVLVCYGESQWNKENCFIGWYDVDLFEKGVSEVKAVGKLLKEEGYSFDFVYIFVLKCVIYILWNVLDELDQVWLFVEKFWKLNECYYGVLQGLNKVEIVEKYGDEQVKQWCCGFVVILLELIKDDECYLGYDLCYVKLSEKELLLMESLVLIIDCVIFYWNEIILLCMKSGECVIIAVYGNFLCVLVKYFDNMSEEEIFEFNILIGVLLVYEFDENFKLLKCYYLGNVDEIAVKAAVVVNQGKVK